ncbi:MAG TPA: T9SS type A sorting domain-containing protein, partial [Chitinophagaceae bacterium]|nr:T9SS type A sorting domain-containing protein [Chitinophagaceae bacterium]
YLFLHALTALLPNKGQSKRFLACALSSGLSLALLANSAPNYISHTDTNRVVTTGTDQITLPVTLSGQIAGVAGNEEFSLPLVMTAYKAILNNGKVVLSWTTGIEKRLSHFVIERSSNGIDYKEVAIVFAVANSSVKQNYSYNDPVNVYGKGILYYRIKLVDPVGKFQNSAVKLIRVGDESSVTEVATYPNPVVSEVRITIPSSWQNQQVKYEVYNSSGRLVKMIITSNANQTEVLNLQDCIAGVYLVRTSTSRDSNSQSIFKK